MSLSFLNIQKLQLMDISLLIQRHFLHGAHFISACYSALKYHFIGTFSIYTSDSDSIFFCTYKINMSSPVDYRPLTVHQYSPDDNLSGNNCKIQIMRLQARFSGMSNWILTAAFCKSSIHFLQGRIHVTFNSQSSPVVARLVFLLHIGAIYWRIDLYRGI